MNLEEQVQDLNDSLDKVEIYSLNLGSGIVDEVAVSYTEETFEDDIEKIKAEFPNAMVII